MIKERELACHEVAAELLLHMDRSACVKCGAQARAFKPTKIEMLAIKNRTEGCSDAEFLQEFGKLPTYCLQCEPEYAE